MTINLLYWKCPKGQGNFGDELSKFIVENMIPTTCKIVTNKPYDLYYPNNLVALGSYIHAASSRSHVWGTGLISNRSRFKKDIKVHAVRGPKTREILKMNNIETPEIYGDPALLLPRFYTPKTYSFLNDKIAVIPHWSQVDKFKILNNKK